MNSPCYIMLILLLSLQGPEELDLRFKVHWHNTDEGNSSVLPCYSCCHGWITMFCAIIYFKRITNCEFLKFINLLHDAGRLLHSADYPFYFLWCCVVTAGSEANSRHGCEAKKETSILAHCHCRSINRQRLSCSTLWSRKCECQCWKEEDLAVGMR